jgi:hypothetical protein
VAADDQTSWIAQLHKLARLHDQGVLSDADFAAAEQRILEQKNQPPGADGICGSVDTVVPNGTGDHRSGIEKRWSPGLT